jgi:hypothetical protein
MDMPFIPSFVKIGWKWGEQPDNTYPRTYTQHCSLKILSSFVSKFDEHQFDTTTRLLASSRGIMKSGFDSHHHQASSTNNASLSIRTLALRYLYFTLVNAVEYRSPGGKVQ